MPPPPFPDTTILNYLDDRERGRHYLLQDFGVPNAPSSDATILSNFNDREGAPLFLQDFSATQCPPSPDDTIDLLNYLNVKERGRHYLLQNFGAPLNAPPSSQTPQYLTFLMTERGAPLFLQNFSAPNAPLPQRHNT